MQRLYKHFLDAKFYIDNPIYVVELEVTEGQYVGKKDVFAFNYLSQTELDDGILYYARRMIRDNILGKNLHTVKVKITKGDEVITVTTADKYDY